MVAHAGLYPNIAESFFELLKREWMTTDRSGEDLLRIDLQGR